MQTTDQGSTGSRFLLPFWIEEAMVNDCLSFLNTHELNRMRLVILDCFQRLTNQVCREWDEHIMAEKNHFALWNNKKKPQPCPERIVWRNPFEWNNNRKRIFESPNFHKTEYRCYQWLYKTPHWSDWFEQLRSTMLLGFCAHLLTSFGLIISSIREWDTFALIFPCIHVFIMTHIFRQLHHFPHIKNAYSANSELIFGLIFYSFSFKPSLLNLFGLFWTGSILNQVESLNQMYGSPNVIEALPTVMSFFDIAIIGVNSPMLVIFFGFYISLKSRPCGDFIFLLMSSCLLQVIIFFFHHFTIDLNGAIILSKCITFALLVYFYDGGLLEWKLRSIRTIFQKEQLMWLSVYFVFVYFGYSLYQFIQQSLNTTEP